MLKNKKILLGVTGGIAAYKSAYLTREFVKRGAIVKVMMTKAAENFVGKLTFATLSKNMVLSEFFDPKTGSWYSHVDLGLWADAFVIAPATANTIAKMAYGLADNLLVTTYLSARCPVFVAPAMDLDMFLHPATQKNLEILRSYGVQIIEPAEGELASGLSGKGRMQEPEKIADFVEEFFSRSKTLEGKTALVTAGPTYEMIDPVRFIGNFSSGKMGYAIARELANAGARVILISGPTHLSINHPGVEIIRVTSATEMYQAAKKHFPDADIAVLAAAVADYRPEEQARTKIKKSGDKLTLHLVKNPDIAKELGKIKRPDQILAGFALETDNEEQNALEKLRRKNFDFIVLNSLRDKGAGFGTDTNKVTIIMANGEKLKYPLKPKTEVARDIVRVIGELLKSKQSGR